MINITLYYQSGKIAGIQSAGHSGAGTKGSDIICAAVSVLMQALHLGLRDVAKLSTVIYYEDGKIPLMRLIWRESECAKAYDLAETAARSLKLIARDNPKYVNVISTEDKNYYDVLKAKMWN